MMHGIGFLGMVAPLVLVGVVAFIVARSVRPGRRRIESTNEPQSDAAIADAASTERKIYQLARGNGGTVTVSDVVADIGLSAAEAEKQLQSMTDESRVSMHVSENGVVTYRFLEFSGD